MNEQIAYSIIIPTHNSSGYVSRLFDSIPLKDNIEIVVIDDYSSKAEQKATKELFNTYNFKFKKFLVNTGVNSAGSARNMGIRNAHGKWLVFADSDDYFTSHFINIMDKYAKVNADIVAYRVNGNSVTSRVKSLNKMVIDENVNQLRYIHVVPWGKMIRKELVDKFKIRFSEVPVSNDEFFSAKVGFYSKSIRFEQTDGYYSFERSNSLTTQVHSKDLQDIRMNEVLKKFVFLKEELGIKELKMLRLSLLPSLKKAVSVGGLHYGAAWYLRIWRAGGRLNLTDTLKRKVLKR